MLVCFDKLQDLFFIILNAYPKLLIIITSEFFNDAVDNLVREDIVLFIDCPLSFKAIGRVPAGIRKLLQMCGPAFMFFFKDVNVNIRLFCKG